MAFYGFLKCMVLDFVNVQLIGCLFEAVALQLVSLLCF